MSVTLSYGGSDQQFADDPIEVPDGSQIIIHRSERGADVLVLPGARQTHRSPETAQPAREASTASALPLDAEQIVRGLGFILTQHLNMVRPHNHDAFREGAVTLALADAMGVEVPVRTNRFGRHLLPYGQSSSQEEN